jgi:hypothetical protein
MRELGVVKMMKVNVSQLGNVKDNSIMTTLEAVV